MKNSLRTLILGMLWVGLVACAPDSRDQASKVATTYEPPAPVVYEEEGGYRVVRGSTRVQDMTVLFDSATKGMVLKGQLEFLPVKSSTVKKLDLELSGVLDEKGFVVLKGKGPSNNYQNSNIKVAAKATCLGVDRSCNSSFIDIYVYDNDFIYHHQVETIQDNESELEAAEAGSPVNDEVKGNKGKGEKAPRNEKDPSPKGSTKDDDSKKADEGAKEEGNAPAKGNVVAEPDASEASEEEEDNESYAEGESEESDESDGDGGRYIGTPSADIRDILGVKPPKAVAPPEDPPSSKGGSTTVGIPEIKATDQVVGTIIPIKGKVSPRLENAVNLSLIEKKYAPTGFHILYPKEKKYFGSSELVYFIMKMGRWVKANLPKYSLAVNHLSSANGGELGDHKSHRNGRDVDVGYFFKDMFLQKRFAHGIVAEKGKLRADWMMAEQWALFKEVMNHQLADRIFVDPAVKRALCDYAIKNGEIKKGDMTTLASQTLRRIVPIAGHANHFHLRVKCSSAQFRCVLTPEDKDPRNDTECF